MKKGFIFYSSFFEAIEELDSSQKLDVYEAIMKYEFYGEETELNGVAKAIFTLIKPQLDANNQRYENGCRGGAPRGNQNAKKTTKKQPKNNLETTEKQPKEKEKEKNKNKNIKEKIYKKEKYGTFGRVELTIDEYLRLVNEFGEEKIKNQIELLDEYVESNDNKNKYKNFNLVLRKSIRENWFTKSKQNVKGGSSVFLETMKEIYDEQRNSS